MTLDKVKLKTINNQSVIGDGNITVGGSSVDIVTSWSSTTSDSKVPSEKLTKNSLDDKISKSQTSGLVKNDGSIDTSTYLTSSSLSNYVQKSQTTGLLKNDGTVDTTSYSTFSGSYSDLSNKPTIPTDVSQLTDTNDVIPTTISDLSGSRDDIIDIIYPVGSIYMSITSTNPNYTIGGTWEQIAQGRTIIGEGTGTDSNNESKTFSYGTNGGEYNHTLTEQEMPSHTHTQNQHRHEMIGSLTGGISSGSYLRAGYGSSKDSKNTDYTTATNKNTGGGQAHNNLSPYFVTYIWKRTA